MSAHPRDIEGLRAQLVRCANDWAADSEIGVDVQITVSVTLRIAGTESGSGESAAVRNDSLRHAVRTRSTPGPPTWAVATNAALPAADPLDGVTEAIRFDDRTDPTGIQRTVVGILGEQPDRPWSPAELNDALGRRGIKRSPKSVHSLLKRLTDRGVCTRLRHGHYMLALREGGST